MKKQVLKPKPEKDKVAFHDKIQVGKQFYERKFSAKDLAEEWSVSVQSIYGWKKLYLESLQKSPIEVKEEKITEVKKDIDWNIDKIAIFPSPKGDLLIPDITQLSDVGIQQLLFYIHGEIYRRQIAQGLSEHGMYFSSGS